VRVNRIITEIIQGNIIIDNQAQIIIEIPVETIDLNKIHEPTKIDVKIVKIEIKAIMAKTYVIKH
jgi:hypothetical protein